MVPVRSSATPAVPTRRGELTVLALGFGTAAALAVVAFVAFDDPEVTARAALERLAQTTRERVRAAWHAFLEDDFPALLAEASADPVHVPGPLRFGNPTSSSEVVAHRPLERPDDRERAASAFETFFDAAEVAEVQQGDLARAGTLLDQALAQAGASEPQRARGHLRALQVASRAGDALAARAHWEELAPLARGRTLRGLSVLAVAVLALDPLRRTAQGEADPAQGAREELAVALAAGEVTCADEDLLVVRDDDLVLERDPLFVALAQAIGPLYAAGAGGDGAPRVELWSRTAELRAWRALATALGRSPAEIAASAEDDDAGPVGAAPWIFARTRLGFLAVRQPVPKPLEAVLFTAESHLTGPFVEACVRAGLLPEDFRLVWEPGPGLADDLAAQAGLREAVPPSEAAEFAASQPLGAPLVLGNGLFALQLCGDVDAFFTSAGRRRSWTRLGLLVAAAACALAGLSAFRALRRERALAALKTRFVANVSHELRTPLASILLLAENLETGRASVEGAKRYPTLIRREARRLARLIEDVLDFARLERGAGPRIAREPLDVAAWTDELEREVDAWNSARGAEIRLTRRCGEGPEVLAAGSAGIEADAGALWRAVLNLVDNALKYGSNEVELEVALSPRGLCVVVGDSGPGIPPGQRERVFEPFARLGEDPLRAGEGATGPAGTGLGLALAREIARAHGGDVRCADVERGARFELWIPPVPGERAERAEAGEGPCPGAAPPREERA